jgi:PAS domain S-box-containing protein
MAHRHDIESRLAAIVASSDDAIVSKDLNGIILTWNRGAERIFGYTPAEAVGQSIRMIIPADRQSEEDDVLARIRQGLTVDHFETVRQRKDGTLIDVSVTISPVRTAEGEIVGASKIARDITEQRRLRVVADEASRLKDEFLAVLSHELRTPLNTVLGYARMLRREDKRMSADLRDRALDALERNADLLTRLVNDVLDTSRVVTGKLRLAMDVCPLEGVLAEAIRTIQTAAEAKNIALDVHLDPGLTVLCDRDRMLQVMWNLLSNAIKFTPSGGSVSVRGERQGGEITIAIGDTGIGISPEHLPFVFQRFWQAHTGASREFGGLGLGLALSRHIVELHGGSIVAESEAEGQGAVFTVTLPTVTAVRASERNLKPVAR